MAGRGESNEIPPAGVVVPVKAFSEAKARLAAVLDPEERRALARRMAETVLAAAHGLPAVVVCDDDAVRQWASSTGAEALWTPGLGLDGAVFERVFALREGAALPGERAADELFASYLGQIERVIEAVDRLHISNGR